MAMEIETRTVMSKEEVAALPRLLDIHQVAGHLGVTTRHVRRLVAERRIPYIKWDHLLRFDPEELAAWLDRSRIHQGTGLPL